MNRTTHLFLAQFALLFMLCACAYANDDGVPNENDDDQKDKKQSSLLDQLRNAAQHQTDNQSYLLRYRLNPGETHRWKVTHFFKTDTSLGGASETTASRNISINCWKVVDVDSDGNITFEQIVEQISMWRKIDDKEPLSWSSESNDKVPDEYQNTASMVGKTQSTYTITPSGKLEQRRSKFRNTDLGIGQSVIEFPDKPIQVGHVWHVYGTAKGKFKSGEYKNVKTRQRYQLIRVENGIASISFDTQLLTPVENPTIKSQLMQKMSRGSIKFDIENGKLVGRDIDWQSTVQGFEGADSIINYNARYNEVAVATKIEKQETPKTAKSQDVIKHRFAPPILIR